MYLNKFFHTHNQAHTKTLNVHPLYGRYRVTAVIYGFCFLIENYANAKWKSQRRIRGRVRKINGSRPFN